jgi:hypothetical protein
MANAGNESGDRNKESNWPPAPVATFSLYIRACWREEAILDGSWQPPKFEKWKRFHQTERRWSGYCILRPFSGSAALCHGVPNRSHTALLFLLTSSSFYPWQDDAEKDSETNRCLPVYSACSMNNAVRKQSHNDGNNQCESEHIYKINEYSSDGHSSASITYRSRDCDERDNLEQENGPSYFAKKGRKSSLRSRSSIDYLAPLFWPGWCLV